MSIENRRLKLPHSSGVLLLRSENRKRSSFGEGIVRYEEIAALGKMRGCLQIAGNRIRLQNVWAIQLPLEDN